MARTIPSHEPPRARFDVAAGLAIIAALAFIVEAGFSLGGQFIARPPTDRWPIDRAAAAKCRKGDCCPSLEQVTSAADPWDFDAMLDVDPSTGNCTDEFNRVPCPTPLPNCGGAYPCCVLDPNGTDFFQRWTRLDRDLLQEWMARRRKADPYIAAQYSFGAVGWIAMLPAIDGLAVVLGASQRSAATVLPTAIKAGAILSLVEFTSQLGATQTADFLSRWPAMSTRHPHLESGAEGATKALEISYQMVNSRTLWLYSADRLLLAAGLSVHVFCTCTARAEVPVSRGHAYLSVVLVIMCILGFALDVMRFISWAVAAFLPLFTVLIDLLLLPIWLVWLACMLRSISQKGSHYASSAHALELSDVNKEAAAAGA